MSNSPTSGLGTGGSLANDTSGDWQGVALSQLNDVLDALMQAKPDRNDPTFKSSDGSFDSAAYASAIGEWGKQYGNVQSSIKNLQLSSMGLHTLPDGTMIASGDLSPDQQAQLDRANQTAYTDILNKFGLDQFNAVSKATDTANQTAQTDFTNRMDQWDRMLGLDKFGFDQATKKLDRWLGVQDQATKEAQLEQDAQKLAIPYGTSNGKTDFSGADLGAGVAGLASMAGIAGNTPVIRYPGTQTMDPIGTINTRSQAMGGGGAAPTLEMPAPLATAGNMPTPPQLSAGPAAPTLQLPPQLNLGAPAPGLTPWSPSGMTNANPLAGV